MKTLIKNPKLEIQSSEDGVWLYFTASNGLQAAINLPVVFSDKTRIEGRAIVQWAKDFALGKEQ